MKTKSETWTLGSYKGHGIGMEGPRWSATLLRDGRKVATVDEDGDGGPLRVRWLGNERDEIDFKAHAAFQPPVDLGDGYGTVPMSTDLLLCHFADCAAQDARLRRMVKKETLFIVKGDKPGDMRTIRAPYTAAVAAHVRAKYGDQLVEIINERAAFAPKGGVR